MPYNIPGNPYGVGWTPPKPPPRPPSGIGKGVGDIWSWLSKPITTQRAVGAGKTVAKAAPKVVGRAAPFVGAGLVGKSLGEAVRPSISPQDWYFNPTEENLARQFGINTMTPYARSVLEQAGYAPSIASQTAGQSFNNWLFGTPSQQVNYTRPEGAAPSGKEKEVEGETFEQRFLREAQEEEAQLDANAPTDPYGRRAKWDADDGMYRYPPDWGQDPATQQAGYMNPYQQAQVAQAQREFEGQQQQGQKEFEFEQQRFAWQQEQSRLQAEANKQRQLSQLRANPASWLEYASLSGQTPVIQPWMVPLGATGQFQAGQSIPGYNPQGQSMNLPELTRPSAQYMNRIAPSQRQQYYGYEQARTGATPEDVQWRMWSGAPPAGQNPGLRYTR